MLLALCHKLYMSMAPMTFSIGIDLNYFMKHDRLSTLSISSVTRGTVVDF
jgi:hypothetical protein